jgi:hypothetical protein
MQHAEPLVWRAGAADLKFLRAVTNFGSGTSSRQMAGFSR